MIGLSPDFVYIRSRRGSKVGEDREPERTECRRGPRAREDQERDRTESQGERDRNHQRENREVVTIEEGMTRSLEP